MSLRFGVAGTGHWARTVHGRTLQFVNSLDFLGFWGRSAQHALAAAVETGGTAFDTFDQMLQEVDAISIALTPEVQPGLAIRAAQAGKALLLEKPLATSLADAEQMESVIALANVPAIVFLMRRFVPEIENAITQATQHPWTRAEVRVHSNVMASASPYAGSVWRQAHGAELWDIGPHVLSVLLPVLGAVKQISARIQSHFTLIHIQHVSGAEARISLSLRVKAEEVMRHYEFTDGALHFVVPDPQFSHQEAFARAVGELLEMHLTGQRSHRCDVGFGKRITRILSAAQRSIEHDGDWVQVQEEACHGAGS